MQEKADDPAFVAQCQSRVKALVCEAALLPVRVDRDLERIQVNFLMLCRQPFLEVNQFACDRSAGCIQQSDYVALVLKLIRWRCMLSMTHHVA